ncbi:MAG: hypothetical protein EOO85_15700 [Pedobacter sp.]|nr:MAG: hypothetical protein EOO85_15700 [Pedobacter sp.]
MKDIVRKSDRPIVDMPNLYEVTTLNRALTEEEYQALISGFKPGGTDDRWFLYVKDDWVYLHRSWTGHCIFKLKLEAISGTMMLTEMHINRDPDQYRSVNTEADKDEANSILTSLLGRIRS